jgi:hypothetical protein
MTGGSGNASVDWRAVAFMGLLLSIECGAVLTVAEWFRKRDDQNAGMGPRTNSERSLHG